MKAQTTIKFIKNNFNCISIGYTDLDNLLADRCPMYYTCGIYGWNFDAYYCYGYMLCTGYRYTPGISAEYKKVHLYDSLARKSLNKYGYYEHGKKIREFLLERLIKETTK